MHFYLGLTVLISALVWLKIVKPGLKCIALKQWLRGNVDILA